MFAVTNEYRSAVLAVLLSVLAIGAVAQPSSVLNNERIYYESLNSLVWVINTDSGGAGSGVLIDSSLGLIVTNHHITDGSTNVRVYFVAVQPSGEPVRNRDWYIDNREVLIALGLATSGRVIAEDPNSDLAVVDLAFVPQTARAIKYNFEVSGCEQTPEGSPLHFLGNPGTTIPDENGAQIPVGLWQWGAAHMGTCRDGQITIAASAYRGNSGGPLLDNDGNLIGIIKRSNMGTLALAAPLSAVEDLLAELQTYHTFSIVNGTSLGRINYAYRWLNNEEWRPSFVGEGLGNCRVYWSERGPNPQIMFDQFASSEAAFAEVELGTFERRFGRDINERMVCEGQDVRVYTFSYDSATGRIDLIDADAGR